MGLFQRKASSRRPSLLLMALPPGDLSRVPHGFIDAWERVQEPLISLRGSLLPPLEGASTMRLQRTSSHVESYPAEVSPLFQRLQGLHTWRETLALTGFSDEDLLEYISLGLLWVYRPPVQGDALAALRAQLDGELFVPTSTIEEAPPAAGDEDGLLRYLVHPSGAPSVLLTTITPFTAKVLSRCASRGIPIGEGIRLVVEAVGMSPGPSDLLALYGDILALLATEAGFLAARQE